MANAAPSRRTSNPVAVVGLKRGTVVRDPGSQERYRIDEPLFPGGFGMTYQVTPLSVSGREGPPACLKASTDKEAWLYESYFGLLLEGRKRSVQQWAAFPFLTGSKKSPRTAYATVLELMPYGTVEQALGQGRVNDPAYVRREIKALLTLLAVLHASSATHGDIHEGNVFLGNTNHKTLVLGDFGLAGHHLLGSKVQMHGWADGCVPPEIAAGKRDWWEPADDLYEVGVLAATMLADRRTDAPDVRRTLSRLALPDDLRDFVYRLTARTRSRRFEDAGQALEALAPEPVGWAPPPKNLNGLAVVLTGALPTMKRAEAAQRILQAGGRVQDKVNGQTGVVVVGQHNRLYRYGPRRGTKLAEAWRRIGDGQSIAMISEADLRRMTRIRRPAKKKRAG